MQAGRVVQATILAPTKNVPMFKDVAYTIHPSITAVALVLILAPQPSPNPSSTA